MVLLDNFASIVSAIEDERSARTSVPHYVLVPNVAGSFPISASSVQIPLALTPIRRSRSIWAPIATRSGSASSHPPTGDAARLGLGTRG